MVQALLLALQAKLESFAVFSKIVKQSGEGGFLPGTEDARILARAVAHQGEVLMKRLRLASFILAMR